MSHKFILIICIFTFSPQLVIFYFVKEQQSTSLIFSLDLFIYKMGRYADFGCAKTTFGAQEAPIGARTLLMGYQNKTCIRVK